MNQKHLKQLTLILLTALIAVSCMDKKFEDINSNLNYANFDFKTTRDIQVNIEALSNENLALDGVGISVYTVNPLNEDGTLIENADSLVIFRGSTGSDGLRYPKVNIICQTDTFPGQSISRLCLITLKRSRILPKHF